MLYTVNASSRLLPAHAGVSASRAFSSSAPARAEKLVILGSGWGGYEVLRRVDKKRYDVTVISPVNYFNFTPLLASAAVGTIEFRCATEAVRRYSPNIDYYQTWVDSIDFKNKTLECMPATPPPPFSGEVSGKPTNVMSKASSSPSTSTPPQPAPGKAFQLSYDKLVIRRSVCTDIRNSRCQGALALLERCQICQTHPLAHHGMLRTGELAVHYGRATRPTLTLLHCWWRPYMRRVRCRTT
ncbi:hypothetical protein PENSPDRAFT_40618 [Peniophora sp. CONT]|nr:hypothetical protein PENSPDRAFT_40618 [Peniophora sp. CONT]